MVSKLNPFNQFLSFLLLLSAALPAPSYLLAQVQINNNPDSIVYVHNGNSITITTQTEIERKNKDSTKHHEPFAPSTPAKLTIDSACKIELTIYDSTSVVAKYLVFNASKKGDYYINLWAFYEDLPSGEYNCIIKYPGKLIRQKFLKVE